MPEGSGGPARPVGCICGLGVRPARPAARPAPTAATRKATRNSSAAAARPGVGRPPGAAASAERWPAGFELPPRTRSLTQTTPQQHAVPARLTKC